MKEFNGDLKGFPEEVVEKMLERQVEQGNKRDVSVFENGRKRDRYYGGFQWIGTVEGQYFWESVIDEKNFDLFFQRYPKQQQQQQPTFPCLMWVWGKNEAKAEQRVVIFKNNWGYLAFVGLTSFDDIDKAEYVKWWSNASLIDPRTKTVTKDEAIEILSNHFNHKVEIV